MRSLTMADVRIEVEIQEEDAPIKGNCSAVDPETDRKCEQHIRRQLRRGNGWAWCTVRVSAHWNGYEGDAYLGCCSYRNEDEFRADAYFEDMKTEALADLNSVLAGHAERLAELRDRNDVVSEG